MIIKLVLEVNVGVAVCLIAEAGGRGPLLHLCVNTGEAVAPSPCFTLRFTTSNLRRRALACDMLLAFA